MAAHQPSLPKWVHSWSSCSSTPRSHYPCTPGTHSLQDNSELLTSCSTPLINRSLLLLCGPCESGSKLLLAWCFAGEDSGGGGDGCGWRRRSPDRRKRCLGHAENQIDHQLFLIQHEEAQSLLVLTMHSDMKREFFIAATLQHSGGPPLPPSVTRQTSRWFTSQQSACVVALVSQSP